MRLRLGSKDRRFWSCIRYPGCNGTHGAHPDGKPLGVPADEETRKARAAAHEAFDWIWEGGHMRRAAAYRMIATRMGITEEACHFGAFDLEQCQQVVTIMTQFAVFKGAAAPDRTRKPKRPFVKRKEFGRGGRKQRDRVR